MECRARDLWALGTGALLCPREQCQPQSLLTLLQVVGQELFSLVLQEAVRCGIHRTVHAGEAGPAAMVKEVRGVLTQGTEGVKCPALGREAPNPPHIHGKVSTGDMGTDVT